MNHPVLRYSKQERRTSAGGTPAMVTILATLIFTVLVGCSDLSGGAGSADGGVGLPSEQEPRSWRMVFVYLDDNELTATVDKEVANLATFPDSFGHTHRVILRDSRYEGATVGLAAAGALRTVPIPSLPAGSLLDGAVLADILRVLAVEFPAHSQALFISGHGRGWSGIGYSHREPRDRITAEDLRVILTALPENRGNLVVLEAGWSAFGELLYEFRHAPTDLVAARTNLSQRGIDGESLLRSLEATDWSRDAMLLTIEQAFRNTGEGVEPAVFRESDLHRTGPYLQLIVDSASEAITTAPDRETLRSGLMEAAVVPDLPGDAHIAVADLLPWIELMDPGAYLPAFDDLLLHLVTVDEIGLPAGHDTNYRFERDSSAPAGFFRDIQWAPDLFGGSGFLFDLWYREF